MEEKLSEIISLVNSKDFTYKSKSLELIEALQNLEKKSETAETQLNAILLNFLIGNYTLYGFNFNLISKETKDVIQRLMKALYNNVLPNVYGIFDQIKTGKESESGDKDIDVSNLSKKLQMWLLGQEKLDPRIEKFLIDETTEKTQHIAAQQDAKKNLERRLSTVNTFYRVPDIIVLGKNTWKTIVANMKKHARGVLVNYINHNYERKEMSAG